MTIKPAILLAIITLFAMRLPDGGDCVRIYGEFKLNSGHIIKGYTHTDRLDFENAEKDFKRFLHHSYRDVKILDSITVFEKIDTLNAIVINGQRHPCNFLFLACPIEKVKTIGYDDWHSGELKNKFPCKNCNQKEYPYSSGGYFPLIITELDKDEIDKLKGLDELNSCAIHEGELTIVYMVSLTNKYSKESLKKLYGEISEELDYHEIKVRLKKLGIAMFRIDSIA